jgi:hypothetical protein
MGTGPLGVGTESRPFAAFRSWQPADRCCPWQPDSPPGVARSGQGFARVSPHDAVIDEITADIPACRACPEWVIQYGAQWE